MVSIDSKSPIVVLTVKLDFSEAVEEKGATTVDNDTLSYFITKAIEDGWFMATKTAKENGVPMPETVAWGSYVDVEFDFVEEE